MKVVKKALCVGVLTLSLVSCSAPHNFMNDQIWHHKNKQFKTKQEMYDNYYADKKVCEVELQEILEGVYDPAFTSGSFGKCLTNKGWAYERMFFGKARKMVEKFPE